MLHGEKYIKNAYMDFGGGLRIKERLNTVPQHSKSRTSIDDEHTVQGLQKEKFNQANVS